MLRFKSPSLAALSVTALLPASAPTLGQAAGPLRLSCQSASAMRYDLTIDLAAKTALERIFVPFADVSDVTEGDPRQGTVTAITDREIRITYSKDNYPDAPTDFVLNRTALRYGSTEHPTDAFCQPAKP